MSSKQELRIFQKPSGNPIVAVGNSDFFSERPDLFLKIFFMTPQKNASASAEALVTHDNKGIAKRIIVPLGSLSAISNWPLKRSASCAAIAKPNPVPVTVPRTSAER